MKRVDFNFLFPAITLVILISGLSLPMFDRPPLGKLLNPFIGVVQNEDEGILSDTGKIVIRKAALTDDVSIFFDDRKVPHIYAKNAADLYFAQGYITSYFRLWQMDFLTYAAAGRLSEILGNDLLAYDRNQRRIGMLSAAKASLEMMMKDPETAIAVSAYTKGVNAYIKELQYGKLPLEYKLMNYKPEPWSELKTVLIMKYMANTLSGYEEDFSKSYMALALGEQKFNKLFPDFLTDATPIVRNSKPAVQSPLLRCELPDYLDYSFLSSSPVVPGSVYNPRLGSNSWAVSGSRTRSGFPVLCCDPHLSFSLPSIWIEMQLSCPGMNVYGVAIPGTPAVIIGFNERIAWGITNGADDVKDWYKLKVTSDYKKYELDGAWKALDFSIDTIRRKAQEPFYDTIFHTVHGPVVYDNAFPGWQPELKNYALKWELHNPSNELLTFIKLSRANNYDDYRAAIAHYACPILNFTFATKTDTIAINHQGKMTVKWPGQGKFVLDGTRTKHLSTKYIPQDSLPQAVNPASDYVLSANQRPTDASYPYYYNGYYTETRANRIRELLESGDTFDIEKMKAMQLDNTNSFVQMTLPILITAMSSDSLSVELREAVDALRTWSGSYEFTDENAKLFELWWHHIKDDTWDEFKQFAFYTTPPVNSVLLNLLRYEPDNAYFDRQGTSEKEDAGDIIHNALVVAVSEYNDMKKHGSVQWAALNKVNLMHLTNIGAFSKTGIASAGHPDAINAMSAGWGPTWRMIVELGDKPKAFGIYPGGQSGNVGSELYDSFVDDWNKGNYYPLLLFLSAPEAEQRTSTTWLLSPAEGVTSSFMTAAGNVPWWTFVIPVIGLGVVMAIKRWKVSVFLAGFIPGFVVWGGANLYFASIFPGAVLEKIAMLLSLHMIVIVLLSGLIGGLLFALALYTGKSIVSGEKAVLAGS